MKKNKLSEKQVHTVLDSLRELLERGPWNNSAFLRVLGKKIQKSHDDLAERAGRAKQAEGHQTTEYIKPQALSETQQEVFIALYSSDGGKLESWEKILMNLPRQAISRPIYAEKKAIQKVFKERRNHLNEAYVSIYISRDLILPTPIEKTPKDRFGNELLTLKNKAFELDNIMRFVHASGEYKYTKGRLIKMPDADRAE